MTRYRRILPAALCLGAVLMWSVSTAQESSETGQAGAGHPPQEVDPLDPSAAAFLDVDLVALAASAVQAYQAHDYKESARRYLELLRHNVDDGVSIYNLACCYGLMGEDSLAAENLRRAFDAGFDDLSFIQQDHDFDMVRDSQVFRDVTEEISTIAQARHADRGRIIYLGAASLMPCRVRLPADYDAEKTYKLIVALHGRGGEAAQFLSTGLGSLPSNVISVAPEGPYGMPLGRDIGYAWWLRDPGEPRVRDESRALTEEYVADITARVRRMYPVSEAYTVGFSQGGALAYTAALRRPDLFDGIVCFAGWLDEDLLTDEQMTAAKGLRVFIGHGWEDQAVAFERAVEAKDTLETLGYDVTFHPFNGGHEVPTEALGQVADWILE
jgi:phospholipase/carboxylesterase